MRQLLALTAREIVDRRSFIWATLMAAVLPWVFDLSPAHGPRIREVLQVLVAIAWPFGLALGLGSSVVAEDVTHGRLSFYFSRPCSGSAIWGAKMGAALVLALGSLVLLLAMCSMGSAGPAEGFFSPLSIAGWLALGIVAAIVVSNAVAVAARSRDGLFGWDLIIGLVLVGLAATLIAHVVLAGAPFLARDLALWCAAAFVVGTAASGLVHISAGRGSARRGHLFLSGTAWGTLGVSLLVAAAYGHWVLNPSPWDTGAEAWEGSVSANGRFATFHAPNDRGRPGFLPVFLVDLSTGKHRVLPTAGLSFGGPSRVSADGRVAVSLAPGLVGHTLIVRRLAEPGWPAHERRLWGYHRGMVAGLSPDGSTALVWRGGSVEIWNLDAMRIVSAIELRSPWSFDGYAFLGSSKVRIASLDPSRDAAVIREVDVTRRTTRELAAVSNVLATLDLGPEAGLFVTKDGQLVAWRPAGVQTLLSDLGRGRSYRRPSGMVLPDGRLAALVPSTADFRLMTWDAAGRSVADVHLPQNVGLPSFFGETPQGWLAIGRPGSSRTIFVDVATGRIERDVDDLVPLGDPAAGIYVDLHHQLVRFDPVTGSRTVVLPVHGVEAP